MVDKLLQLSRLEAVNEYWPATTVDLPTMAEEAAMLLMPEANRRNLKLIVEGESLQATIPGKQLFRILVNLLQNAVRHTTDQVVIRVDPEVPGAAWAIHIEYNGPGLADEEREAVFERFFTGTNGVTGLGLAICRQIAARLNGEWGVDLFPLGAGRSAARFSFRKKVGE
ncbi:HAMP domain-containing sensor histidine kinase [Paenibacillus sp. FSL H8-0122]|uniref:sensor histidine kinase n=1 Tax=Paenibacillus sp. FSL H8-0122 TaxID=2954510 RepID=UPI0030F7A61D